MVKILSEKTARVSVTLPKELLDEVDEIIDSEEYSSRSKAFRDALRNFLADYRWRQELEGNQFGTVILVYNHHVKGLVEKILDIQHEARDIINSVQHQHITHEDCLETLMVEGEGGEIRELADDLEALRGVKQVRVATIDE